MDERIPTPRLVASICRHGPGDSCARYGGGYSSYSAPSSSSDTAEIQRLRSEISSLKAQLSQPSPDPGKFEVIAAEQVGTSLVLKLKYEVCGHRVFEGVRILVFRKTTLLDALRWRRIDPHFGPAVIRDRAPTQAPHPSVRFPATPEGWEDAIRFAREHP